MRNLCSTDSITGTSLSVYSRSKLNNHQLIQFAFYVRSLLRRTFRRYVNSSITVSRGEQEDPTMKPFFGFKLAIFGYLGDKWFLKPNVLAVIYIRKLDHGTRCKWQTAFNWVLCLEKKEHDWPFFYYFSLFTFLCLTIWLHSQSLFNWHSWAFPNHSQVKSTSFFKKHFHKKDHECKNSINKQI